MNLYLAPLHEITQHTFRTIFTRHFPGFDRAVLPFIVTVTAEKVASSHLKDIARPIPADLTLIPQILGNDADRIAQLAQALVALGYDDINLNLGCPVAGIARKKRGSGLLPYPERIAAIVERVLATVPCRLSLKLRLGSDRPDQIFALLPWLEGMPLDSLIIHPRLGVQGYGGRVDLVSFEKCLAQTRHNVVYNGDIFSIEQFLARQQTFGNRVSNWMIGRGALINPFLVGQIKTGQKVGPVTARLAIKTFHDELYHAYRDESVRGRPAVLGQMKELWNYLAISFDDRVRLLQKIWQVQDSRAYEALIDDFFASQPAWNPPHGDFTLDFPYGGQCKKKT